VPHVNAVDKTDVLAKVEMQVGAAKRIYLSICPVAILAGIGVVIYALLERSMPAAQAVYLIVTLTLFCLCFTFFLGTMFEGDNLVFESNWGGLGGGLSGWTISPPLIFLLLSIGSLALLVVALGTANPQTDVRERYRAALNFAAQKGIQFDTAKIVGGKLILTGTAPQASDVNALWDQVKLANPIHDDFEAQLTVRTPQQPAGGGSTGSTPPTTVAPPTGAATGHPKPGR
jgi:hypothetical protein